MSETQQETAARIIAEGKPITLVLAYATKGTDSYEWGSIDDDIAKIVGFHSDGSGTDQESGERDLTFSFPNFDEAKAAAAHVGERFSIQGRIFDWMADDPPHRTVLQLS